MSDDAQKRSLRERLNFPEKDTILSFDHEDGEDAATDARLLAEAAELDVDDEAAVMRAVLDRLRSIEERVDTGLTSTAAVTERLTAIEHTIESRPVAIDRSDATALIETFRSDLRSMTIDIGPVLEAVRIELADQNHDVDLDVEAVAAAVAKAVKQPDEVIIARRVLAQLPAPVVDTDAIVQQLAGRLAELSTAGGAGASAEVLEALASRGSNLDLREVTDAVRAGFSKVKLDAAPIVKAVLDALAESPAAGGVDSNLIAESVADAVRHATADQNDQLDSAMQRMEDRLHALSGQLTELAASRPDSAAPSGDGLIAAVAAQEATLRDMMASLREVQAKVGVASDRGTDVDTSLRDIRSMLDELKVSFASLRQSPGTGGKAELSLPVAGTEADTIRRTIAASHRALTQQMNAQGVEFAAAINRERESMHETLRELTERRSQSAELVALDQLTREINALKQTLRSDQV